MSEEITVRRWDSAPLGATQRTPQGFLRAPARLTRTGVLEYRVDGKVRRELRHPDDVFHADSLATLAGLPLTDLHPPEMVNPGNVRRYSVGHGADSARRDGIFVAGAITVESADAIAAVERRDRTELSCGYLCRIDAAPGVYEGQAYDVRQRDIRYNHVALCPPGGGRAGSEVALRLDGTQAAPAPQPGDGYTQFAPTVSPAVQQDHPMDEIEIKLDGVAVKVPAPAAARIAHLESEVKRLDTASGASSATIKDLQGQLASAKDPKHMQEAVAARVALESGAGKILGTTVKLDSLSVRQIHEHVIVKAFGETKFDGMSDDFVAGMYASAQTKAAAAPNPSLATLAAVTGVPTGETRTDAKGAREAANLAKRSQHLPKK